MKNYLTRLLARAEGTASTLTPIVAPRLAASLDFPALREEESAPIKDLPPPARAVAETAARPLPRSAPSAISVSTDTPTTAGAEETEPARHVISGSSRSVKIDPRTWTDEFAVPSLDGKKATAAAKTAARNERAETQLKSAPSAAPAKSLHIDSDLHIPASPSSRAQLNLQLPSSLSPHTQLDLDLARLRQEGVLSERSRSASDSRVTASYTDATQLALHGLDFQSQRTPSERLRTSLDRSVAASSRPLTASDQHLTSSHSHAKDAAFIEQESFDEDLSNVTPNPSAELDPSPTNPTQPVRTGMGEAGAGQDRLLPIK